MTEQATQGRMEQAIRELSDGLWNYACTVGTDARLDSIAALISQKILPIHREELAAAEDLAIQQLCKALSRGVVDVNMWAAQRLEKREQSGISHLARHDQELTERVLGPVKALAEKWRTHADSAQCYEEAASKLIKAPGDEYAIKSEHHKWTARTAVKCAAELEVLLKAGPR